MSPTISTNTRPSWSGLLTVISAASDGTRRMPIAATTLTRAPMMDMTPLSGHMTRLAGTSAILVRRRLLAKETRRWTSYARRGACDFKDTAMMAVEAYTGIPREVLRPDIYPAE